ncbi:MAG: YbdD/YjiX family protein [Hyphomicrobium sp.]
MLYKSRLTAAAAQMAIVGARVGRDMASTARLMVGVPDYERYVAHRKASHPGEPVMTYEEFFRERQSSRYGVNGGKISRCC